MIELSYSCPEDIAKMSTTDCGRLCSKCQVEVYDFRGESTESIRQILNEDSSIHCGIFDESQAKENPRTKLNLMFRFAFAAIFIFGFNFNILFGQDTIAFSQPGVTMLHKVDRETIQITGTIFSEEMERIPFAQIKVAIDSVTFIAISDLEGNFVIDIPSQYEGRTVSINFKSFGYLEYEWTGLLLEKMQFVLEVIIPESNEEMILVGLIIEGPPLIDVRNPRPTTKISGDDIKHRP